MVGGGESLSTWLVPTTYLVWKTIIYMQQVDLADTISLLDNSHSMSFTLKAHLRNRYMAIDFIWGTPHLPEHWLQSRKPSSQQYHVIIALAVYKAMEPCLPNCAGWLLTPARRFYLSFDRFSAGLINTAECLAIPLNRKD